MLVGLMKKSTRRKGNDPFALKDFDLTKIPLTDTSISTLSLKTLKEILLFIDLSINKYSKTYKHKPNYNELRLYLMPQKLYR